MLFYQLNLLEIKADEAAYNAEKYHINSSLFPEDEPYTVLHNFSPQAKAEMRDFKGKFSSAFPTKEHREFYGKELWSELDDYLRGSDIIPF